MECLCILLSSQDGGPTSSSSSSSSASSSAAAASGASAASASAATSGNTGSSTISFAKKVSGGPSTSTSTSTSIADQSQQHLPTPTQQQLLKPSQDLGPSNAFLAALLSMEVSLKSIDVVNRIVSLIELPLEFVHLYITNCISSCEIIRNTYMQVSR